MQQSAGTSLEQKAKRDKDNFIIVFVRPEEDVDMDLLCVSGKRELGDYFPLSRARLGFSDGTLIDYDYHKEEKLTVLKEGENFHKTVNISEIKSTSIMLWADGIKWHVYEDIY